MKRYIPKTSLVAAAAIVLAGCAVDPVVDHASGGAKDQPAFSNTSAVEPDKSVAMIVGVAKSTVKRGDLPTGVALYRRALAAADNTENLTPKFQAAVGLADALGRLGAHEEAADAWRIALKISPNDTTALRGMANTLVASGRPALAIGHYERALSIKPEPRLYNGIGVAHDMLNEYSMAQAYYRVGLKDDEKNLSLRNNLGLSLMLAAKLEQAVAELKRVASHPAATTQHRMNLALALVLAGDSDSALSISRMDLGPRGANEQIAYFETIRAMGDAPTARQAIQAHIHGTLDQKRDGNVVHPVAGIVDAR